MSEQVRQRSKEHRLVEPRVKQQPEWLDAYMDRMEGMLDKIGPKPSPLPPFEYKMPEPARFNFHDFDREETEELVREILALLQGKKISNIIVAGNVVEQYVSQQSNGVIMTIPTRPQPTNS